MSVCECERPAPVKQAVEAGPIWNQGDAQAKCPGVCKAPATWTGQWWTTVQGKMSVCECEQ
ncbi:MAG: mannan-binding lectin [Myxococcota bacterium]